jgi:hypothetical protein
MQLIVLLTIITMTTAQRFHGILPPYTLGETGRYNVTPFIRSKRGKQKTTYLRGNHGEK